MFNIEYLGNLDKPFNFLIRSRKQPYNNTTGYERSETDYILVWLVSLVILVKT